MIQIRHPSHVLAGLAFALAITGCGQGTKPDTSPDAVNSQALREVGEMYRLYSVTKKKPPTKADDCKNSQPVAPAGFRAAKDGTVVVLWGATMGDTSEEGSKDPDDVILAYAKDVPENGGPVLMLNRTVRTMTADEFKTTKKAGKG